MSVSSNFLSQHPEGKLQQFCNLSFYLHGDSTVIVYMRISFHNIYIVFHNEDHPLHYTDLPLALPPIRVTPSRYKRIITAPLPLSPLYISMCI